MRPGAPPATPALLKINCVVDPAIGPAGPVGPVAPVPPPPPPLPETVVQNRVTPSDEIDRYVPVAPGAVGNFCPLIWFTLVIELLFMFKFVTAGVAPVPME
jgi:hypothetical protein